MSGPCPQTEQLEALLRCELPQEQRLAFEQHVEACASCQERLEALAPKELHGTPHDSATSHPAALDSAMHNLKAAGLTGAAGAASDAMLSPGARLRYFGDYEILEELGRGGMGVVYRARQVSLNRPVALKLILSGQLASPAEVRRFHNEAETAAKLDHPNIVPIYEIGEHEGRHYFSMKLVEGKALAARIAEFRSRRSSPEIALLVAQVARAVHFAHQRSVLHRDLKPANILLDANGQPHLTDFGLAKLLGSDAGLTRSQAIMGTPDYLSPEVAAGKAKEVTTAADIFSLGAILYEILTGSPPFHADTTAATLQNVLHAEPPPPRTVNPAVPRDLETIVLKCLEKEPARRYSSAAAVADELERFARGESILARPVGVPERVFRWAGRNPRLAALTVALHVVLALGLAGILREWRRAERNAERVRQAFTRLEVQQADALLPTMDSAKALALLARSLRRQPENRVATERLLSALTIRPIALPVAEFQHGPALGTWKSANVTRINLMFPFYFTGSVVAVNFSPHGSRIVTASEDGTARIWDALSGQPIGPPLQHEAEVLWAEFSPDGQLVVTASMDHTARVWDADTGEPVSPPLSHSNIVWHAAFGPDGRQVISASEDKTACIWETHTGRSLRPPFQLPWPVIYAAFSPNGRRIVTAGRTSAYIWDCVSGKRMRMVMNRPGMDGAMPFPQFSQDSRQLLSIHTTRVMLADTEGQSEQPMYFDGYALVRAACLLANPDRIILAAGNRVRMVDIPSERLLKVYPHGGDILSLQSSADGRMLLTASTDRTARLWDVEESGRPLATLNHETAVVSARLSPDQRRIVTVPTADTAWLWQMRTAPAVAVCSNSAYIEIVRFSSDGRKLLVTTHKGLTLWETESGRELWTQDRPRSLIASKDAHFGDAGVRVLYVSSLPGVAETGPLRQKTNALILDVTALGATEIELVHSNAVRDACFSPDGRFVATASRDHTAAIWESGSGRRIHLLPHHSAVNAVVFSPDGEWLATATANRAIRLWTAATGQSRLKALRHKAAVRFILVDPRGELLAAACSDNTVHLWSTRTGEEATPPLEHLDRLQDKRTCCFSPDGSHLVSAAGTSLQVWDTATGKSALSPLELDSPVTAVRFSPAGRRIVVAKLSGAAVILDAATGQTVSEPLQHEGPLIDATFSPDGTRVATVSTDHTLRIWPTLLPALPSPPWLPELAEAIAGQRLTDDDVREAVPVEKLLSLRQQLTAGLPSDDYGRWVAWFLSDNPTRSLLPPAAGK